MLRKTRIAIIGAGLGGMTAAAFLQREGFDVSIYEQASAFSRVGAGIILSPNVAKVLAALDLEDMLVAAGIKADCYISRAWDTGEVLYRIDFDAAAEERFGGAYLNVHRGDLHGILDRSLRPKTVKFDHKLLFIEEGKDALRLGFENGAHVEVDIVIGADGLNSKVRESLFGAEPLRFFKAAALRTIFPTSALNGFAIPDCTKWWGPDRHALPYFLTSRRDEIYIIGIIPWSRWDDDVSFLPSSPAFFRESFADFHDDFQKVIQAPTDVTLWPIFDRPRNDTWTKGHIALLGDACHPVPPYMGAGGAMAIEDAVVLSRCLASYDAVDEAFDVYQRVRVDRVGHVQRISWENSWMRGPTETDWLYCYNPCTAPLVAPEGPRSTHV
ncbi:MAG TPA: FAD-dependent monooxygenase [Xanthobacteraceae bacterium]|nr:FAD-dependent monooxygenase [Xanthobacteraceae bacterium]